MIEPFLIQQGYVQRTSRGRMATARAYRHFGLVPPAAMGTGSCSPNERRPVFSIPVRVYYEDTDVGAVVYYANYLRFIERARSDWLRAAGFELDVIQREQNAVFVVRRVEADYYLPPRWATCSP